MGLTSKQSKFAANVVAGMNPSEAYRAAGYRASNPSVVAIEAARLMKNPHISPIIEKGRCEAMHDAAWNRAIAIYRLQKVNDDAFEKIDGGDMSPATMRMFFSSLDRLNKLVDVDFQNRARREACSDAIEQSSNVLMMFDRKPLSAEKVDEYLEAYGYL